MKSSAHPEMAEESTWGIVWQGLGDVLVAPETEADVGELVGGLIWLARSLEVQLEENVAQGRRRYRLRGAGRLAGVQALQRGFHPGSVADNARGALVAEAGEAFLLEVGEALVGEWWPVTVRTGEHIDHLIAVALRGERPVYGVGQRSFVLEPGLDYEVDLPLGLIRLLRAPVNDRVTPLITAPAVVPGGPLHRWEVDGQRRATGPHCFAVMLETSAGCPREVWREWGFEGELRPPSVEDVVGGQADPDEVILEVLQAGRCAWPS